MIPSSDSTKRPTSTTAKKRYPDALTLSRKKGKINVFMNEFFLDMCTQEWVYHNLRYYLPADFEYAKRKVKKIAKLN